MNNAVFGKTMENVRNHVDVKLVTKWDDMARSQWSQNRISTAIASLRKLITVELRKLEAKPIYVGMCILDISKVYLRISSRVYVTTVSRQI